MTPKWLIAATPLLWTRAFAEPGASKNDLTGISLQELMNIEVTSVGRKEQKLSGAAAAIYVITQEDIHRSAATSLPELLRMVPGLQVARINFNEWAISARGFNDQFANKMLVLIDGRSVYTPLFSGVYWDIQDTMLEDIDRIEVIRGPGATMWGANAVNGVINILTKRAQDTQGGLVSTGGGSEERSFAVARYGGKIGRTYYRVYGKEFKRFHPEDGRLGEDDHWNSGRGGFRIETQPAKADSLTLQGDIYQQEFRSPFLLHNAERRWVGTSLRAGGGNLSGTWTHSFSDTSTSTLHVYYDRYRRVDDYLYGDHRQTWDADFQHRWLISPRHDVLWGGEVRMAQDRVENKYLVQFVPPNRADHLFGGFLQDDISLAPDRLHLILGAKAEDNSFAKTEFQPSVQLAWTPTDRHTLWAAVSRAARSPSRADQDLRVSSYLPYRIQGLPVHILVMGNPQYRTEYVLEYQLGARVQPWSRLSFDLATFYGSYDQLTTVDALPPVFQPGPAPEFLMALKFRNALLAKTVGAELTANYNVTPRWHLSTGYSWLRIRSRPPAGSTDPYPKPDNGQSPAHQGTLRSYLDITSKLSVNALFSAVGRLPASGIPGYARTDAFVAWHPLRPLEIGTGFHDLFGHPRMEFIPVRGSMGYESDEYGRSAYAKVTWYF